MKKSTHCLNCEKRIGDSNYCHHCGQRNTDKRIPIKDFFHDFLKDYFTFDSKFFRSLFPLLCKPGYLTNEYTSGRRVNFIFPLRLYLFTTFLFFFVVAVQSKIDHNKTSETSVPQTISKDSLLIVFNTLIPSQSNEDRQYIVTHLDSSFSIYPKKDEKNIDISITGLDSSSALYSYFKGKEEYLESQGQEGIIIFWKSVVEQIPKVLFIMVPFFALILKLLYLRRKRYYVEHLVFSFHIHTFIFLFLLVPFFIFRWYTVLFIFLAIVLYLFVAMKRVYEQSFFKTLVKMCVLLFVYLVSTVPAFMILVFLAIISV
ncbi:MAG: DUF3667 domain-containing protein [bacterium]